MTAYEAHLDVASYALGVLDPGDVDRFEEHLVTCDPCATELEALLPVTRLLAQVDRGAFGAAPVARSLDRPERSERVERAERAERVERSERTEPPPRAINDGAGSERMAKVIAFERRRSRFRTVVSAAVAASVAAVATLAVSVSVFGQDSDGGANPGTNVAASATGPGGAQTRVPPPSSSGAPSGPTGTTYSSTDPRSGAKLTVVADSKLWGSQLNITLTKVRGALTCTLLVVGRDGKTEAAGTWWVLPEGYGTTQHPEPLTLTSSTSMQVAAIDRIEIRAVGSDGANPSTLVSVKL
jgi:hypothetical protein